MDQKLSPENFKKINDAFGEIYSQIHRVVPDNPEKGQVLLRLTEAGMWLRMGYEMDHGGEIKARMKEVPKNGGIEIVN